MEAISTTGISPPDIAAILDKLERAHIDIIECGFLTGMVQDPERSLFGSAADIQAVLPQRERKAMYVAMIAIGEKELHPAKLAPCDGKSITGIRLTFHQDEIDQAVEWAKIIMGKGYECSCSRWGRFSTPILNSCSWWKG